MIGRFAPRAQRYNFLPQGQGSGGLVPPVIAVMGFLTALALAGGFALGQAAGSLGDAIGRTATVQVIAANPIVANAQADAAARLLARDPAVAHVRPVPRAELERLLEPWLGPAARTPDLLPLPPMVDVELRPGANPAALAARVRAAAPAARFDAHAAWLGPVAGVMRALQAVAVAVILFVAGATAAVVALGTRSALGVYRPTIELLHMMGAEDADIARVFQYRYLRHGLVGGVIGVGCALAVLAGLGVLGASLGGGLVAASRLPVGGWLALALLPVAMGLLAAGVARLSVGRALEAQL